LRAFGKIDDDELNELYSANIRVNKARKITQTVYVYLARMGGGGDQYGVLVRKF
jgi:hypothetical protein